MQEHSNSQGIATSLSEELQRRGLVSRTLSALAFGNFGVRLGLEITLSVLLYLVLKERLPWSGLKISLEYHPLLSWFAVCAITVVADRILFYRPVCALRDSYRFESQSLFSAALRALESISPYGAGLVACPAWLFHLRRAQIIGLGGNESHAWYELELARASGLDPQNFHLARSEILKQKSDLTEARAEVERGLQACANNAALALEHALLWIYERREWKEARKSLESVSDLPQVIHTSGDNTSHLARAFCQVTRLWTGEAEQGLEQLNSAISELSGAVRLVESIRPVLAQLVLERAYYYATHREPEQAATDVRLGLALCSLPRQAHLARLTAEELQCRHQLCLDVPSPA